MTYTDEQLKRTLAKMLPAKLTAVTTWKITVLWIDKNREVLDTELLSICHEIKQSLTVSQRMECIDRIYYLRPDIRHPEFDCGWEIETIALAQVLGVEIV